jgi:hypothetical protein
MVRRCHSGLDELSTFFRISLTIQAMLSLTKQRNRTFGRRSGRQAVNVPAATSDLPQRTDIAEPARLVRFLPTEVVPMPE